MKNFCETFEKVMYEVLRVSSKSYPSSVESATNVHTGQIGEIIWELCLRELGDERYCVLRTSGFYGPANVWEYIPVKGVINLYQVKTSRTEEPANPSESEKEKIQKLKKEILKRAEEHGLPVSRINAWLVRMEVEIYPDLDTFIWFYRLDEDEFKDEFEIELGKAKAFIERIQ